MENAAEYTWYTWPDEAGGILQVSLMTLSDRGNVGNLWEMLSLPPNMDHEYGVDINEDWNRVGSRP